MNVDKHNMFSSLLSLGILVFVLLSSPTFATRYMWTYEGKVVKAEGRPLMIGSGSRAGRFIFHQGSIMNRPENAIGYIDWLAVHPESHPGVPVELDDFGKLSFSSTKGRLALMTSAGVAGEPLHNFNGRVVIDTHMGSQFSFELNGANKATEHIRYARIDARKMGRDLAAFSREINAPIQQIDLQGCCGDNIVGQFIEGLRSGGMDDFVVNTFKYKVATSKDYIFFAGENNEYIAMMSYEDFYIKNRFPDLPEKVRGVYEVGKAKPVVSASKSGEAWCIP